MTKRMRIVIPGGAGQVGRILARHCHDQGHGVTVLSRTPRSAPWKVVAWDGVHRGDWTSELESSDICINLAGQSVNCRYNQKNRQAIYDSRVLSTQLLNQVIVSLDRPPRLWLNASTAAIYSHAPDRAMDEANGVLGGNEPGLPSAWKFPFEVAQAWEQAFFSTCTPRTRKIAMRSSIILSPDRDGIFDVLMGLVRHGLGGTQGSGSQYVSWIHEADFVRAIELLIAREELSGIVNLASPNPVPNWEFMRALRVACGVPFGLPSPAWMIGIGAFFLRTEPELVLKNRRVTPNRLLAAGFQFRFPDWQEAARELVTRWRAL